MVMTLATRCDYQKIFCSPQPQSTLIMQTGIFLGFPSCSRVSNSFGRSSWRWCIFPIRDGLLVSPQLKLWDASEVSSACQTLRHLVIGLIFGVIYLEFDWYLLLYWVPLNEVNPNLSWHFAYFYLTVWCHCNWSLLYPMDAWLPYLLTVDSQREGELLLLLAAPVISFMDPRARKG